ncbi:Peptidyl-prolyl cis-trans isomerase D [Wickerhamomyces ciferrii]|uniref:peptidylprolyl isomerase n=1 Tax=Wickerhamomyces ciferrii (strain ATCC 14091 / BCRC 22168 / CBS 111 / JCM 3599 / NBRC 0793 / NRRL Y-1031 F-60-10) TaxID=1206466 RepID=K0KBU0_WICCF|nr:Peptidyl-prolyl cis-trans isomerase D [Wickerhamomyces ciferrii]CCH42530.1 Peptidyl-prolyl cis-trans isomerase D [Wickerhamomyces ciferrii]
MGQVDAIHPKIYLDISIGGEKIGRIVAELYEDAAPKAYENFLHLCKGDKVDLDGKALTIKGNHFHKVIKNFMIQGGDITHGSSDISKNIDDLGKGGSSIYATESNPHGHFEDENLGEFSTTFNLAMANTGPNTNASQFFINTYPSPHLNGKHTIFGKVIHGKSTVRTIEYSAVDDSNIPKNEVTIEDCGEWEDGDDIPVYNTSYNQIGGDIYEEYPDDDDHFDDEKVPEQYEVTNRIKESGSLLFKQKNYQEALFKYKKALRYVVEYIPEPDQEPEYAPKFEELKRKLYLNLALTSVNLKDFQKAIDYSTYLLETETALPTEKAKSFYRKGLSLFELKKYNDALYNYKECFKLNSKDSVVERKIEETEKIIQDQKDKEKQKYAKFFGGK